MATALLLIDLQNDYFAGGKLPLTGILEASANAARLLEQFRNAGQPLVHVRHVFESAAAPFFQPNTPGAETHASVTPLSGETVITKHAVNSFQQTALKSILDRWKVDSLVICGAMSQMCVEGTTRAAADLGYKCQVIHDACATCDQKFAGRTIPAADVHGTAMSALGFAYAEVLSLADWRRGQDKGAQS
jgi:nicotinamidase-related amidase